MAVVADRFESQWRDLLITALGQVTGDEKIGADRAMAALSSLTTAELLALDKAMRREWRSYYPDYTSHGRAPVLTPISDPIEGSAYLFTAACQGNGFIRERAIVAFEHYPGRLALVAALIRCDDWVVPVQQAAVKLLQRLINSDVAELIFEQFPLLLRLHQRQRLFTQVWTSHIQPILLSPRHRDPRWRGTKSPDPATRAFAYRLVLQADSDRAEDVFRCACADLHPEVSLWGLRNVETALDPITVEAIVRVAIRHHNAAVRAAALRRYAAIGPGDLRDVLEVAIFDSSRGPRDAAAHLLGRIFQVLARERWRQAIDSGATEQIAVAVAALSYVAEIEDIDRFEPFLNNPAAPNRAAALRGLVHAKAPRCDEYYRRALGDPSGLVVRRALSLIRKEGQLLGLAEMKHSYSSAQGERVRRQLIRAARLMGKWDALTFLLPLLATADASIAREEMDRWIQLSNRRFTVLDSENRVAIAELLAELSQSTNAALRQHVEEIVRHS